MNDTKMIIDAIEIMKRRFSQDSTALWVTATGKPELFVRDHFGAIIAEKLIGIRFSSVAGECPTSPL